MDEKKIKNRRHANQIVSAGCLTKNQNVSTGNSVFPRSRFREEGAFVHWLPFNDLSTFHGKICQFPPCVGNTHSSQERVVPNPLLSNSWPLHGFIIALLSYLDDFDVAVLELRLLHPFCWRRHCLADVGPGTTLSTVNSQAKEKKLSIGR